MKEYGLDLNGAILTSLKSENFFIGTKVLLLHHVLIPHRVMDIDASPEYSVITADSRLTIYTYSENKDFLNFSMVLMWALINTSLECYWYFVTFTSETGSFSLVPVKASEMPGISANKCLDIPYLQLLITKL